MSAEAGPSQPSPVQPQVGKKRKRTGKEREERKQAAILAAAQAKEDEGDAQTEQAAQAEESSTVGESKQVAEPKTDAVEGPVVDLEALEKRLPRALTHLRHVFKKAKTIEMTRLIRKIKHLRTKPEARAEMEDLEAQRELLAHINLVSTYSSHLLTNLRKHRLVKRTSTTLPPSVVKQLEPPSSSTVDDVELVKKVENRLCSSKAAAQEMKNAVAWLMSEEGAKLGVAPPSTKVDASNGKSGQVTKGKGQGQGKVASTSKSAARDDEDDDEGSEGDDDEAGGSVSISRRVVVDSDEDEKDDGAGWESGSVSGSDDPVPSKSRRQPGTAIANSDSDSEEDSIPVTRAPKPKKSKTESTAQSTNSKGKALTTSTFLPSLSTGFTRGDSDDSDPDDDFGEGLEDVIGKQKAGPRKNRRGQQARRLIWERKYGKNAKHVQKAQAQESEGNIANAYGKRAATAATAKPTSAAAPTPTANSHGTSASARPTPALAAPAPRPYTPSAPPRAPPASTAVHTGPGATGLHPSWEAARLRKQKEAAGPKATKIVFD